MPKRIAVYAGSFDPFTLGHLDIATRAASMFDTLIIAMGNNPAKKYLLSYDVRKQIIHDACSNIPNIEIKHFDGLLIHFCQTEQATIIVRGLRSEKDLSFEVPIALANKDMAPNVETIFLLSEPKYQFVSSSLIKEIAFYQGDVQNYVTSLAKKELDRILQKGKQ